MPIYVPSKLLPTIVETATFSRQIDGLLDKDGVGELMAILADDPLAGDLIPETGGVRKMRFARPGSGKSGGLRIIYWFLNETAPLFALLAYGKSGQEDLSPEQKKAVTTLVEKLKAAYARKH
jgi:hypothetical protein